MASCPTARVACAAPPLPANISPIQNYQPGCLSLDTKFLANNEHLDTIIAKITPFRNRLTSWAENSVLLFRQQETHSIAFSITSVYVLACTILHLVS